MDNSTSFVVQPVTKVARAILDSSPREWIPYTLGFLAGYPIVIGALRYRRMRQLQRDYPYKTREDMAKMTDEEAFHIQKTVAQLEFPFMFIKSLQFALFRVGHTIILLTPLNRLALTIQSTRTDSFSRPMVFRVFLIFSPKLANFPTQRLHLSATQTPAP